MASDCNCYTYNNVQNNEDVDMYDDNENGNGNNISAPSSSKDRPINIEKYCIFFLNQEILRDEPCLHSNTKCVSKQKRCADEMESVVITCLSCGKIQKK